ncbi:MAG: nucleoside transporter C-terminal domain-containing protein [Pirellulaceae bacterium]
MNSSFFLLAENEHNVSHLNVVSLFGLLVMVGLAWLMSSHRSRVNWSLVVKGLLLQAVLAAILFSSQNWTMGGTYENGILFWALDGFFGYIKQWTDDGANFVFAGWENSKLGDDKYYRTNPYFLIRTFAFGVMPTVIFFSALMSVLYYLGIMQRVVRGMAWVMQRTLGTTGPESLASAANVFVGHTEAPLVIRPYVGKMTISELNALMIGGFATITGGLMAVFVSFGVSAGHLVVASIVSAPAAILIAKILQPETEPVDASAPLETSNDQAAVNVIEAAANGASEGVKLAINIVGMLIAFLALIAMANTMIGWIGELVESMINSGRGSSHQIDLQWSLSGLFGLLFFPLAWVMGIEGGDCFAAGNLLGTKIVLNEFVAYSDMGGIITSMQTPDFDPSKQVSLSDRTILILTYALCGFSNFGAIGIQLGGIGALAPERRSDLARLGLRAMFGGMLACCMTACIAGALDGVLN